MTDQPVAADGARDVPAAAGTPSVVVPARSRGRRRGRRTGLADPGAVTIAAGAALLVVSVAAVWAGWVAMLLAAGLVQVAVARAWADWLEVPAATACAVAVLVVAAVADAGVVVGRVTLDPVRERADGLDQLAPALGTVVLAAFAVQLLRRDHAGGDGPRPGAVAGIATVCTGGLVVVGLAAWLPVQASRGGDPAALAGLLAATAVVLAVGARAWVAGRDLPPPSVLVPAVLALVAGPAWVLARLLAG